MKRLVIFAAVAALAVASLVLAQSTTRATLRLPAGDRPLEVVRQGELFVSADDIFPALGGSASREGGGMLLRLNQYQAAIAPESRYAVVRDDLIEMSAAPLFIDGRVYLPVGFVDRFLKMAADLEARWNPSATVLTIAPPASQAVTAQVSLVDLSDFSKLVIQTSQPIEYRIERQARALVIRFAVPVRAPFQDQQFDNPHVSRVQFGASEARIALTGAEIIGDDYQLTDPPRVVIDFRRGVSPVLPPGTVIEPRSRPTESRGIRTIVIDPGHGGKEAGAVGPGGMMEKDLTLAISRRLASLLQQQLGARVILTREDDSQVSLEERTAIANRYRADLFISVHLNAALVRGARGAETYFLSLEASDELARRAAERENQSSTSGIRGSSELDLILWDLAQQNYLKESSRLAELIQEELNSVTDIRNRGVKQAPFKVLVGATMPAALVEIGFISNPEEEAKLSTEAYQRSIAQALLQAVRKYKDDYEVKIGLVAPPAAAEPVSDETAAPAAGAGQ
jgi:N-acetylmuramoyl-L-alanine amidase